MTQQLYTPSGLPVPYITLWDAEQEVTPPLKRRHGPAGLFLGFEGEDEHDRDHRGALWARYTLARGKGTAELAKVHPLRQRRAMTRNVCQVGGGQLELDHLVEPPLFLLQSADGQPIREGELTTAPPLCRSCAAVALSSCPPLQRGAVAARVTAPMAWGVAGIPYDLDTLRPLTHDLVQVSYWSDAIRQVLAYRAVVSLREITPVDARALTTPALSASH